MGDVVQKLQYVSAEAKDQKSEVSEGRWHIITLFWLIPSLIQLRPLGYITVVWQLSVITLTYVYQGLN